MTSSIPGKAVDGALRLARFPADRLLKVAPETGATATVGLAIDRADAAVRGAAGSVLSDHGLREDAERRRAAADERERAMRLAQRRRSGSRRQRPKPTKSRPNPWLDVKRADEKARQKAGAGRRAARTAKGAGCQDCDEAQAGSSGEGREGRGGRREARQGRPARAAREEVRRARGKGGSRSSRRRSPAHRGNGRRDQGEAQGQLKRREVAGRGPGSSGLLRGRDDRS